MSLNGCANCEAMFQTDYAASRAGSAVNVARTCSAGHAYRFCNAAAWWEAARWRARPTLADLDEMCTALNHTSETILARRRFY